MRRIGLTGGWLSSILACTLIAILIDDAGAEGVSGERAKATGLVLDSTGKPLDRATVLVYEARVSKGYSPFCPTCWADCGKHVLTDASGRFQIDDLRAGLKFKLLALKSGYSAAFVENVDPSNGPAPTVNLKTRPAVEDFARVVRGRVVDRFSDPVRDAVVEPHGVFAEQRWGRGWMFGSGLASDPMAVTNQQGEFEIAYDKPAQRMILKISPRGMAERLIDESTGSDRKTITVTEGTTVVGRLVDPGGKPVANAEIALEPYGPNSGRSIGTIRIGTREDGTFSFSNVPPGRVWALFPTMESLAPRQLARELVPIEPREDGQTLDVGEVRLRPAHRVRGRIIVSDGKPLPPDVHLTLLGNDGFDSQVGDVSRDGHFEFKGLPKGVVRLSPGARGYELVDRAEIVVDQDRDDVLIRMRPNSGEIDRPML